jgi:hypothetical protein
MISKHLDEVGDGEEFPCFIMLDSLGSNHNKQEIANAVMEAETFSMVNNAHHNAQR